jgi:hypothetical protein
MLCIYLTTCFAQRQSVLAGSLLACLPDFAELDRSRACAIAVLGPPITSSLPQILGAVLLTTFERLVLGACLIPTHCLLTALVSPKTERIY